MAEDTDRWVGPPEDPRRYRVTAASFAAPLRGGQSIVFPAERSDGADKVALKLMTGVAPADFDGLVARLDAVSRAGRHPHVGGHIEAFLGTAPVPDPDALERDDFDTVVVVDEWVEGVPLPLAAEALTLQERLGVLAGIAAAVDHLHATSVRGAPLGVVHRDIKPSNILVGPEGSAVLVDFGVARPAPADNDHTSGIGTYGWTAPELTTDFPSGDADLKAADRWAVGAVAHWLLTGQRPTGDGSSPHTIRLLTEHAAVLGAANPAGMARHLAVLLDVNERNRPSGLVSWARQLASLSTRRSRRRRRLLLAPAVVAAAVLAGAMIVSNDSGDEARGAVPAAAAGSARTMPPEVLRAEVTRVDPSSRADGGALREALSRRAHAPGQDPVPTEPIAPTAEAAGSRPESGVDLTPTRSTLAVSADGAWTIELVQSASAACVELTVTGNPSGPVLCRQSGTGSGVVGDVGGLATVDTTRGRFLLMTVSDQVTSVDRPVGGFREVVLVAGPHSRARYVVAVGDHEFGRSAEPVLVRDGAHTVARVGLAVTAGETPRDRLDIQSAGVYGRWSGYRKAGIAGLIYGGIQEVGFYQGSAGTCVLYRRLGLEADQMLADACLDPVPGFDGLWHSSISAAPPGYDLYELLAVVRGIPVAEVRCSFCDSTPFIVQPDPQDPSTVALTFTFIPPDQAYGEIVVDLVAPDGSIRPLRIPGLDRN